MGKEFCCPARRKNADNPFCIARFSNAAGLLEDQREMVACLLESVRAEQVDAVVIAGDIYDRSAPSAESVAVFDWFLTRLSEIKPVIPVMIGHRPE